MKSFPIHLFDEDFNLALCLDSYRADESPALILFDNDTGEEFAVVTVCLPDEDRPEGKCYAFIDTNNCPWAPEFLTKNKLGKQIPGWYGYSGYCCYPLFKLSLKNIRGAIKND